MIEHSEDGTFLNLQVAFQWFEGLNPHLLLPYSTMEKQPNKYRRSSSSSRSKQKATLVFPRFDHTEEKK